MFSRSEDGKINTRRFLSEVYNWAEEEVKKEDHKIGMLICEGEMTSIDYYLYSHVYPDLFVVPVGGCSSVTRLLPKLRDILAVYGLYAYAIIDRDALTKGEMKRLYRNFSVNTTKLPFIENIICSPEVLRVICDYKKLEYRAVYSRVTNELIKTVWQKIKEALPLNLGIDKTERIIFLEISANTKRKNIVKQVSHDNVLYTYRDKIIINVVSNAFGIKEKKGYYKLIIDLLENSEMSTELTKAASNFLPKFELYDLMLL